MANLKERIEQDDLFLDSSIISHGFAPHWHDYQIVIEVPASTPIGSGSYWEGRYRYQFTHCPDVRVTSVVSDEMWQESWDEDILDFEAWERAGNPEGLSWGWGVYWVGACPGLSYVSDSALAESWSTRMGREMHEVCIESNVFDLRLVCHDLIVLRTAMGNPLTGELTPCKEVVIPPAERRATQWADRTAERVRAARDRLLRVRPQ